MAWRRKRNLYALTWIAGAVVIAGGAAASYLFLRRRCPPGRHVGGDTDYIWPRPDLFLDESGFGEALETFGYDMGPWDSPRWSVCQHKKSIADFQRDHNAVYPTGEILRTDGLIDDPTVLSMAHVDELQKEQQIVWPLIVNAVARVSDLENRMTLIEAKRISRWNRS